MRRVKASHLPGVKAKVAPKGLLLSRMAMVLGLAPTSTQSPPLLEL
jgi:hypothetical protein